MNVPRKAQPLIKAAGRFGFVLVRRNKHLIFRHPSGAILVTSATAGDKRAVKNVEQSARRALAKA
jgi:predicted RNA binding protein YcfA (HicA-like mRNA interferase family)